MTTMTIHSGPERRRRWSAAEKLRIVEESLAGRASIAEVARRHDLHPNLLHLWRRQARIGAVTVASTEESRFVPVAVSAEANVAALGKADAAALRKPGGGSAVIEVVLRNGRVLRLPDDVAPARVIALADALEGIGR